MFIFIICQFKNTKKEKKHLLMSRDVSSLVAVILSNSFHLGHLGWSPCVNICDKIDSPDNILLKSTPTLNKRQTWNSIPSSFFFLFLLAGPAKAERMVLPKIIVWTEKKNFLIIFQKKNEKRLNKIVKCWQPGGLETLQRLWNLKINCRRTSRVKVEEAGDAVFSLASWVKHDGTCSPGIFS